MECLLQHIDPDGIGNEFLNDKVILRCPVEKCDRKLSMDEFHEHSEAKCISYKISQHECEIQRLAALKASILEARMTNEKEKTEIKKLEKSQLELDKKIISLEETLEKLMTNSGNWR